MTDERIKRKGKNDHNFKNEFIGAGFAIGVALGAGIGVAIGNLAIWIAIGVALGPVLGLGMTHKQDKENKK